MSSISVELQEHFATRADLARAEGDLKADLARVEGELHTGLAKLETRIAQLETRITRWGMGLLLAITINVLLTLTMMLLRLLFGS